MNKNISNFSNRDKAIEELFGKNKVVNEPKVATAEELLKEMNITNFPIRLEDIAENYGIEVKEEFLDDEISGEFYKENGRYFIILEKSHSETRKRFTFAHELAHFFLHKNLDISFKDKVFFRGAECDKYENEANHFASELLMPKEEFSKQIRDGNNTIQGLAKYFLVSTLAIRVRAKQLNINGHGL